LHFCKRQDIGHLAEVVTFQPIYIGQDSIIVIARLSCESIKVYVILDFVYLSGEIVFVTHSIYIVFGYTNIQHNCTNTTKLHNSDKIKFIIDRIKLDKGLTNKELSAKMGLSISTIDNYYSGRLKGDTKVVLSLEKHYPSYFKTDKPLKQIQSGQGKPTPYNPTEVTATAQMAMADAISVNPDTVIRLPMMINAEQVVPVYGHSMKGYIDHGDHIAIRRVTDSNRIIFGEPYVVVTRSSSMRTVKFVNENKDDLDKLWLSPYNTEQFDSQCIEKSDILEMHIVLGKLKNFNI